MKAERGKVYALIINLRAHQIFDIRTLPECSDALTVVEVTGAVPPIGAVFDPVTSTFSPPPAALPTRAEIRARAQRQGIDALMRDNAADLAAARTLYQSAL